MSFKILYEIQFTSDAFKISSTMVVTCKKINPGIGKLCPVRRCFLTFSEKMVSVAYKRQRTVFSAKLKGRFAKRDWIIKIRLDIMDPHIVTFPNRLGGPSGQWWILVVQGTIKILMESDFSSDLILFLTKVWGLSPSLGGGGVQPNIGASQRDLKLRPCGSRLKYIYGDISCNGLSSKAWQLCNSSGVCVGCDIAERT